MPGRSDEKPRAAPFEGENLCDYVIRGEAEEAAEYASQAAYAAAKKAGHLPLSGIKASRPAPRRPFVPPPPPVEEEPEEEAFERLDVGLDLMAKL